MKVAGWTPLSLSDFPGRSAAVVFTAGCNFRCPFCHNGGLLTCAPGRSWNTVCEGIRQRRSLLDGVVISGGEPTLQSGLAECLAECHALGLQTKLDTNGSHPDKLGLLLREGQVDFVAMDIKAPWDGYARLAGGPVDVTALQESVRLIADSGIAHQFRTTYVPALLTEADLERIRAQVPTHSPHRMQPFIPERALDPALRRAS
jgi:pyruvate formate lyase activating enzyme